MDPTKKYPAGALAQCGPDIYLAERDTHGFDPYDATSAWKRLGPIGMRAPQLLILTRQTAINVALARHDGWKFDIRNTGPAGQQEAGFWHAGMFHSGFRAIPEYWNDLKSIMSLVGRLDPGLRDQYLDMFDQVVAHSSGRRMATPNWLRLTAGPEAHCEAYLRLMGEWAAIANKYPNTKEDDQKENKTEAAPS